MKQLAFRTFRGGPVRAFLCTCTVLVVSTHFLASASAAEKTVDDWIRQAGNLSSDSQRLDHLKRFRETTEQDTQLQADLDRMIAGIERYLHDPNLCYFNRTVFDEQDWDFGLATDSPLHPLTYLYRARMLIWVALEHGGVWNVPARRREFLGRAVDYLERAKKAFPENGIARMYLGEPLEAPHPSPVQGAPRWAT